MDIYIIQNHEIIKIYICIFITHYIIHPMNPCFRVNALALCDLNALTKKHQRPFIDSLFPTTISARNLLNIILERLSQLLIGKHNARKEELSNGEESPEESATKK